MIIGFLRQEHRNMELLLSVLERELHAIAGTSQHLDYPLIRAVISYFKVYPETYHHRQEALVLKTLEEPNPKSAEMIGILKAHRNRTAERLCKVWQTMQQVIKDHGFHEIALDEALQEFIKDKRSFIAFEDRHFFAAAINALRAEDWQEIEAEAAGQYDCLFSETVEAGFEILRAHVLELQEDAGTTRQQRMSLFHSNFMGEHIS